MLPTQVKGEQRDVTLGTAIAVTSNIFLYADLVIYMATRVLASRSEINNVNEAQSLALTTDWSGTSTCTRQVIRNEFHNILKAMVVVDTGPKCGIVLRFCDLGVSTCNNLGCDLRHLQQ